MNKIEEAVSTQMGVLFQNLLNVHIGEILERAEDFAEDGDSVPVTFKFCLTNIRNKKVTIDTSVSVPGQKIADGLPVAAIDLDSPELPMMNAEATVPITGKKRKAS